MGKRRWRDYRHGNYRLRFFQGEGCAVWYEGGRRHRYRLGVTEEIAARSALDAFARRREQLARSGRETVGDLWAMYRADRATDGKQMAAFDYNWQALAPRFAKIPPAVVDAALCRAYAAERIEQGRSQGTVWSELTRLRSCLNWAARNHKTDARFTVWVPSKPRPAKRVLTPDEAAALLDACTTPHVRLFVILALATGGREAAICELTWDRVDFERQTIDLRTGVVGNPLQKVQRKGRAQVHMSEWVRAALTAAREGALSDHVIEWARLVKDLDTGQKQRVYGIKRPGAAFDRAAQRAGLGWVTPHTLRHTAASWAEEAGVPMQVISRFMGHSTEAVTRGIYAKPGAVVTKPAADVIEMRMRRKG